jgi:hypothetical protein
VETVVIRKIKRPGTVLTWSAYFLDEDSHGLWLFTPTGSPVHNNSGEKVWHGSMGLGVEPGFLWLMPRDEWWFGAWWTRPDRQQIAIDACTPAALVNGIWTWTDLELDVCRDDVTGETWIEDEDEFDEAVAGGYIPSDEQAEAGAVTAEMERRLRERVAPFDDEGWDRYRAACALHLAALDAPVG